MAEPKDSALGRRWGSVQKTLSAADREMLDKLEPGERRKMLRRIYARRDYQEQHPNGKPERQETQIVHWRLPKWLVGWMNKLLLDGRAGKGQYHWDTMTDQATYLLTEGLKTLRPDPDDPTSDVRPRIDLRQTLADRRADRKEIAFIRSSIFEELEELLKMDRPDALKDAITLYHTTVLQIEALAVTTYSKALLDELERAFPQLATGELSYADLDPDDSRSKFSRRITD